MARAPYRTQSDTLKLQRLIEVLKERGSDLAGSLETKAKDFLSDVKPKRKPLIPHYESDDDDGSSYVPSEKGDDDDWGSDWEEWNDDEPEEPPAKDREPVLEQKATTISAVIPAVSLVAPASPKVAASMVKPPEKKSGTAQPKLEQESVIKPILSVVESSSSTGLLKFPTLPVNIPEAFEPTDQNKLGSGKVKAAKTSDFVTTELQKESDPKAVTTEVQESTGAKSKRKMSKEKSVEKTLIKEPSSDLSKVSRASSLEADSLFTTKALGADDCTSLSCSSSKISLTTSIQSASSSKKLQTTPTSMSTITSTGSTSKESFTSSALTTFSSKSSINLSSSASAKNINTLDEVPITSSKSSASSSSTKLISSTTTPSTSLAPKEVSTSSSSLDISSKLSPVAKVETFTKNKEVISESIAWDEKSCSSSLRETENSQSKAMFSATRSTATRCEYAKQKVSTFEDVETPSTSSSEVERVDEKAFVAATNFSKNDDAINSSQDVKLEEKKLDDATTTCSATSSEEKQEKSIYLKKEDVDAVSSSEMEIKEKTKEKKAKTPKALVKLKLKGASADLVKPEMSASMTSPIKISETKAKIPSETKDAKISDVKVSSTHRSKAPPPGAPTSSIAKSSERKKPDEGVRPKLDPCLKESSPSKSGSPKTRKNMSVTFKEQDLVEVEKVGGEKVHVKVAEVVLTTSKTSSIGTSESCDKRARAKTPPRSRAKSPAPTKGTQMELNPQPQAYVVPEGFEVQKVAGARSKRPTMASQWRKQKERQKIKDQQLHDRLASFGDGWSKDQPDTPSPVALAESGFFYLGLNDCVKCSSCELVLSGWEPHDDVWGRHAQNSPGCGFLLEEKGPAWIKDVYKIDA